MTDAISRRYDQLASLRQPILDNPNDPKTDNWLILADYLEEVMAQQTETASRSRYYQASADLIRAQCAQEKALNSPSPYCKKCGWAFSQCFCQDAAWFGIPVFTAACRAYLQTEDYALSSKEWKDPGLEDFRSSFSLRRGLVDTLWLSLGTFLDHWEVLFDRHPITQITITTEPVNYHNRRDCFAWLMAESLEDRRVGVVPEWIFKHLRQEPDNIQTTSVVYPNMPVFVVQQALGAACIKAAREALKLPLLSRAKYEPDQAG